MARALPFPSPGDLSDPGIKSMSLTSPALAGRFFTTSTTWEAHRLSEALLKKKKKKLFYLPKACIFHGHCMQNEEGP